MHNDDQLKKALQTWRDVEPAPGFEDRVWRRIETAGPAVSPTFTSWLRDSLLAEPAWVPAVSALAGVLVAAFLVLPSPSPRGGDLARLKSDTLSGSYVRLVSGNNP